MKKFLFFLISILPLFAFAQDDLIKKLNANTGDSAGKKYSFTPIINLETTSVKDQGSSSTCWSYSTNSFLESEMIRMGKKPVDIAEMFTTRWVLVEKAEAYVRMHGGLAWGDGGTCHDVIDMYRKYGAVPQSVYTGLNYGTTRNKFAEMQAVLQGMLSALVKNPNGKLTPNWKKAFTAVVDTYLGEIPEHFTWNGREYTPRSFADEVVGINADDYIELSAFSNKPLYKKTVLMVPDNWSFGQVYNIKMNDITDVIDHAIRKGYTVTWATDVSEKYFSWKNGVAFVPEKDWDDMNEQEQKDLFNGPQEERKITSRMRQAAFDDYETTDDHGMQIVGLAKDQNGREYYIVKNSWGEKNDYKGYIYVTKAYVRFKTTAFLLNRKALTPDVSEKLGLN